MCRVFGGTNHYKENEGGNHESFHYRHWTRYRGRCRKVAGLCTELNINIEDVTQSILQGMFAMIMLVDLSNCNVDHEQLHKRTDALAAEMGMQINVTRQEVFDAMHTI